MNDIIHPTVQPNQGSTHAKFDVEKIRADFPILKQQAHGHPLVYLDTAVTSQKPRHVIDAVTRFYQEANANIHRGIYLFSERATKAFEDARNKVKQFINARDAHEIIFVRGTTEAINLVAQSYGRTQIKSGDEIILSAMEHHANIVPWQLLCEQTGAVLRIIPINDAGELLLDEYQQMLNSRTKLVSIVHVSNALGTINPAQQIIAMAHQYGVPVLLDGAQALPHMPVDVQYLDCDFYAFSGHKAYAPTGIGVLYGKTELLRAMPPYQGGGDMISQVSFAKTTYKDIPYKFEAGTPHIAGAIGLGAALDYLNNLDKKAVVAYENELLTYATNAILEIPGVRIIGTAAHKASILSFVLANAHPHDIATILDNQGVAIRAGHHCTMPLMERFQVPATARASFAFYNTYQEIDIFIKALWKVQEIFA